MKLTIQQAKKKYRKSEKSLYMAISEGRLAAEKSEKGNILLDEEDLDYYCQEFKFPNFSPLTCLIKCLGLTSYSVMNDVDSGVLLAFKRNRTWFVEINEWHSYLLKINHPIIDKIDIAKNSYGKFKIKNRSGLSTAEALFFCKAAKTNRKNLIYVHGRGRTWIFSNDRSLIFLLDMEIFSRLDVQIKVYGKKSKNILNDILMAANENFGEKF